MFCAKMLPRNCMSMQSNKKWKWALVNFKVKKVRLIINQLTSLFLRKKSGPFKDLQLARTLWKINCNTEMKTVLWKLRTLYTPLYNNRCEIVFNRIFWVLRNIRHTINTCNLYFFQQANFANNNWFDIFNRIHNSCTHPVRVSNTRNEINCHESGALLVGQQPQQQNNN